MPTIRPTQSTTPSQGADAVSLDAQQLKLSRSLIREFRKLTPEQRETLVLGLQAESPGMWQQIHDARLAVEAKHIHKAPHAGTPVKIDELPGKLGWEPGGWQMTLLKSLDEPGGATSRFKTPGQVSVGELLAALRNPDNPTELSTSSISRLKHVLTSLSGSAQGEVALEKFTTQWRRELLEAADKAGDGDRTVSAEELTKFLDANPQALNKLTLQNLAVMLHQVATVTGEPDPYRLGGLGGSELSFVRSSYAGAYNKDKNCSTVVCQVITAQDIKEKKAFARDDAFRADGQLDKPNQVTPGDYDRTGFDRGHLASNADGATAANAFESFLMSNMAPQYPKLNRGAWRFLEDKVRDIIEATGATAIVYTGTLYLDKDGKQLTEEQLQRIGRNRVAVPSHSFKSLLLRMPDGTQTSMSFMVANRPDLPNKEAECGALLRTSRVSVADLEKASGVKSFFEGFVSLDTEAALKGDKTAGLKAPDGAAADLAKSFEFLFGATDRSTTWKVPLSTYEVDMYLERAQAAIKSVKSGGSGL